MIEIGDEFLVKIRIYDCDNPHTPSEFGLGLVNDAAENLIWIDKDGLMREIEKHDINQKKMLIQREIKALQKQLEEL